MVQLRGTADLRRFGSLLLTLARSVAAVVIGYAVLVLLSTLAQEGWLGGVSYHGSSLQTLILASVFTPMAAVIAGFVTAMIARKRVFIHALPICLGIAVETTLLYRTGGVDGPLWFEALAGATLIGGVLLGVGAWHWYGVVTRVRRRQPPDRGAAANNPAGTAHLRAPSSRT